LKIAVLGSKGLLGAELVSLIAQTSNTFAAFHRGNFDIKSTTSELTQSLGAFDIVINAIAYTNVDLAEEQQSEALFTNGTFPGELAKALEGTNSHLIHLSTDYVFDGFATEPYLVSSQPNPQTSYGRSKFFGEQKVLATTSDATIVRTAWLYGARGECFPKTIANKLLRDGYVRVVDDQIGQPTWAKDVAREILKIAETRPSNNIIHAVSSGQATWADFAAEISLSLGFDPTKSVTRVQSSEFVTKAARPHWSVLDNSFNGHPLLADWKSRWREASPEIFKSL